MSADVANENSNSLSLSQLAGVPEITVNAEEEERRRVEEEE